MDLLGLDSVGNYVLCELKYSGGDREGNGDPADADDQLIEYARLLREDGLWFRLHKDLLIKHNFDFAKYLSKPPRLMVVADVAYWAIWKNTNSHRTTEHKRTLCSEVEHYSIDVSAVDFVHQKEASAVDGRYLPKLPERAVTWNLFRREEYAQS